jgi:hypothetical protein
VRLRPFSVNSKPLSTSRYPKIPKDLVKQTDPSEDTFIDENAGNSDYVHLQNRIPF